MEKQHHTVGWKFAGPDGGIYRCTRYMKRAGYDMRVIAHGPDADKHTRAIGETCNVSERAPGRSFHQTHDLEPAAHEAGCECYICEPDVDRR